MLTRTAVDGMPPPPENNRAGTGHSTAGDAAAPAKTGCSPKAALTLNDVSRERLRQTLMNEFKLHLPAMLESSGRDSRLPDRSLNVIRLLARLDPD
jgi:hypothetical protein